jgi:predicted DNA-binding transcriptional regulator AlpA
MNTTHNNGLQSITKPQTNTHYLSDAQIAARYGVSRQTVWRWTSNDPQFPTPIKLSAGCTRWRLSDLEAWEVLK